MAGNESATEGTEPTPVHREEPVADEGTESTLELKEHPTVEIVVGSGAGTDAGTSATEHTRRRKRWLWWLLSAIVVLVLVMGVAFVETVGRSWASALVRDKIVSSLGLSSHDGVTVDLGSGSLLVQALTGGVDVITIDINRFEIGGLAASARVVATEVPIDSSKPLETLTIDVAVPGDHIDQLAGNLSGLELDSIELEGDAIRVSTVFEVFFIKIPVAVDLIPVAAEDAISFEPQSVLLGDDQISVADLRENQLFSGLAGSLLASREFCVASSLPTALTIDNVEVDGTELLIQLSADGIALDDEAWNRYGSCPAS